MTLLADVRLALRLTSTAYDDEVQDIIDACCTDLKMSGVAASAVDAAEPDALIKRAIILYAKAQFGLDNPDADRYMFSYHALEIHLSLSTEYQEDEAVS